MSLSIKKKWLIKPVDQEKVSSLQKELGSSKLTCTLLVQRNIDTLEKAKKFFRPELKYLYDPYSMLNMQEVIERIQTAIAYDQNILAYGDYDVDGTMSVSMFYNFFCKRGATMQYYIPDRFEEGYGLSRKGVDYAIKEGIQLLITMDCGIKEIDNIAYAMSKGIDVIIIDHHIPGEILPPTKYILNPKQKEDTYPFKDLSAGGLVYKLLCAWSIMECGTLDHASEYLELAALSTAADVVPLVDENRQILSLGLKKINQSTHIVISKLLELSGKEKKIIDEYDIGFILGPRINAIGRLGKADEVVRLFTSQDKAIIEHTAPLFNKRNEERQNLDRNITTEALEKIESDSILSLAKSTVLCSEHWHKGVLGIVASKLMEYYYRPTIICTLDGDTITCSARSVEGYNILEALHNCKDLLTKYGGHKYAAGLSLLGSDFDAFVQRFEEVVSSSIEQDMLVPKIHIDAILEPENLSTRFYNTLAQMAPFGEQNPKPIFKVESTQIVPGTLRLLKDMHITFMIVHQGVKTKVIGFNMPSSYTELSSVKEGDTLDLAVEIMRNEWRGNISLELLLRDYKILNIE